MLQGSVNRSKLPQVWVKMKFFTVMRTQQKKNYMECVFRMATVISMNFENFKNGQSSQICIYITFIKRACIYITPLFSLYMPL